MKEKWIELGIEITIFILGLVGNIFLLIIVHKMMKNKKTNHGIFVTSLAFADLMLLCFDSPKSILSKLDIRSSTFDCRVHLTAVTTGYNAGLFTITSMAIHRCHIVTHPWKAKLKQRGAMIWVLLIWLAAFVLVIPLIVVNIPKGDSCKEDWPSFGHRQAYTASLMTLQYILPLLTTAICYIRIWLFLRRRPVMPRSSLTSESLSREDENSRESAVILRTVAVIVLLFLVLLLPTQVAWMLYDFRNVSFDKLWLASDILTRLHSCLNPVVYGIMNKQYRRSYIKLLRRMFCCSRDSSLDLAITQLSLRNHVANKDASVTVVQVRQISAGDTLTVEEHALRRLETIQLETKHE